MRSIALLALLLAACSTKKEKTEQTPEPEPEQTPTPAPEPTPAPTPTPAPAPDCEKLADRQAIKKHCRFLPDAITRGEQETSRRCQRLADTLTISAHVSGSGKPGAPVEEAKLVTTDTSIAAGVKKGPYTLAIRMETSEGTKPRCTADQLEALAIALAGALP